MFFKNEEKLKIIKKYGRHQKDTGSSEVQIALLTKKINKLQIHFVVHKKDYHSKRGLLKMVSKRKKQLNYLKRKNFEKYNQIIEKLNLRY